MSYHNNSQLFAFSLPHQLIAYSIHCQIENCLNKGFIRVKLLMIINQMPLVFLLLVSWLKASAPSSKYFYILYLHIFYIFNNNSSYKQSHALKNMVKGRFIWLRRVCSQKSDNLFNCKIMCIYRTLFQWKTIKKDSKANNNNG